MHTLCTTLFYIFCLVWVIHFCVRTLGLGKPSDKTTKDIANYKCAIQVSFVVLWSVKRFKLQWILARSSQLSL